MREPTLKEMKKRIALANSARAYAEAMLAFSRALAEDDREAGNEAHRASAEPLATLLIDAHEYLEEFYPEILTKEDG